MCKLHHSLSEVLVLFFYDESPARSPNHKEFGGDSSGMSTTSPAFTFCNVENPFSGDSSDK